MKKEENSNYIFNLGINTDKNIEDILRNKITISYGFLDNKLVQVIDKTLYYNGYKYKIYDYN